MTEELAKHSKPKYFSPNLDFEIRNIINQSVINKTTKHDHRKEKRRVE